MNVYTVNQGASTSTLGQQPQQQHEDEPVTFPGPRSRVGDIPLSQRRFSDTGSYDSASIDEYLFDDEPFEPPKCYFSLLVYILQKRLERILKNNRHRIKACFILLVIFLYIAYFAYAMNYEFHVGLLVLTILIVTAIIYYYLFEWYGEIVLKKTAKYRITFVRHWRKWIKWVFLATCVTAVIVFIALDIKKNHHRLISLGGIFVYIILSWFFSIAPAKVSWHIVFSGMFLQTIFGLIILRWRKGFEAFEWFGDKAVAFLDYTNAGSDYVFGRRYGISEPGEIPTWVQHEFAMKALMAIIFFGACVNLLYYWGILQIMIRAFGRVMQVIMNVGPIESFCAAANVFLGPSTSVLTIRAFINPMTLSELHCIFTSGFATVSGSLLAAYQSFGVPPVHLIAGSVMSAPAALSFAKLLYPEVQKSKLDNVNKIKFEKSDERSPIQAFAWGATSSVMIVAAVMSNLIAFVALLEFANRTVEWFGIRVGVEITLEKFTGWLFTPFAFLMGIEWEDCDDVGQMLGTKIFLTEIMGFIKLGDYITTREKGLPGPTISPRSEVIATYALCGFASFADAGILLGSIGTIAPERKRDMTKIVIRAMVAGNLACWVSACIAGFLYPEE